MNWHIQRQKLGVGWLSQSCFFELFSFCFDFFFSLSQIGVAICKMGLSALFWFLDSGICHVQSSKIISLFLQDLKEGSNRTPCFKVYKL